MKAFELAIYCDLTPKQMVSDEVRALLGSLPFTHYFCSVETSKGVRKYDRNDARRVAAAYPGKFCCPVAWPAEQFTREYIEWLWQLHDAGLQGGYMVLDLEHQYKGVADAWEHALMREFEGLGRVTTHTGHPIVQHPDKYPSGRLAYHLEVQALSVAKRDGKDIPPESRLASGHLQRLAVRLGKATNGLVPHLTLPAYGQTHQPGGPIAAMSLQLQTALDEGCPGVSVWSLKHFLRNDYAVEFWRDHAPVLIAAAR